MYPHTNIPRDKSTPGGDTYNTRSERMQYSKYEQEESHLSVPLFSGISLGPVYEFVCISFRTDNLNCFRVS